MRDVVAAIAAAAPESAGRISFDEVLLPFPEEADARSLEGLIGRIEETPFAPRWPRRSSASAGSSPTA